MRTQLAADVNSIKSYQTGTNEILNKLRIQMEARLNSTTSPLAAGSNPLSSQ